MLLKNLLQNMWSPSEVRVLQALLDGGPATRGELALRTRLSRPTVERALRALIRKDLVQAIGPRPSGGGRPPVAYAPRSQARLFAGVDLELPRVDMILTDLTGEPLARTSFSLDGTGLDPTATLRRVSLRLQEWVEEAGYPWGLVLGLGVAFPGPVAGGLGSLLGETLPTWIRVPIQAMLERELRVPVRAFHDLHLLALAEARLGGWKDEIMLLLSLRPGLRGEVRFGASVLLDGQPYWGAHGNGGALLQAYVPARELSGPARLERLAEALAGRAVHPVALLDPDRVVVEAGLLGEEAPRFLRRFRERLEGLLHGEYPGPLRISLAKGGEFGGALGAALAVQGELVRSPEIFLRKGGDGQAHSGL